MIVKPANDTTFMQSAPSLLKHADKVSKLYADINEIAKRSSGEQIQKFGDEIVPLLDKSIAFKILNEEDRFTPGYIASYAVVNGAAPEKVLALAVLLMG